MNRPLPETQPTSHARLEELYHRGSASPRRGTQAVVDTIKLIGFCLANEEFVIEIEKVKEIIRVPLLTRVSRCPPFVEGIANLRGEILQILNFHKIMGLEGQKIAEKSRIIVLDDPNVLAGIIVDSVSEVLEVEKSAMQNPPEIIAGDKMKFLRGIIKQGGHRSILWLDCAAIYAEYINQSISLGRMRDD